MYRIKLFRDRIVLNKYLKDYLLEAMLKPAPMDPFGKRKILLAAREIVIQENYTFELPDCDLVMVADDFNAAKGTVKLSVTQPGAPGQQGFTGRSLTILCKNWIGGTSFLLKGGKGGKGLTGARGVQGKDGEMQAAKTDGGDGGKGGTGLRGGTGGEGGELRITYALKKVPGILFPAVLTPGGDGGEGGNGGPGGSGGQGVEWCKPGGNYCVQGKDGHTGLQGNTGGIGLPGQPGSYTELHLTTRDSYKTALSALAPLTEWADYRFIMGEYFFRAFNYNNPSYLKLAMNEFDSVLMMDPTKTMASNYRSQLLNNQNILGLSRDADIIPDFNRYEKVYIDYYPIVNSIFEAASDMLRDEVLLSQKKHDLERQIMDFEGMISSLGDDLSASAIGKEMADKEVTRANQRLEAIKQKIADRKEELENAAASDFLGVFIGMVGAIVGVIAAIPTMGASLVGTATSIAVIADTLESAGAGEIISQATDPDADQTELNKLKTEAKGLKGFVEDMAKGVGTVISFVKMVEECRSAQVEDEEYKELIEQAIELAHQQLIAKMHQGQAGFSLQASEKRYQQAIANKDAAEKQLAGLSEDIDVFEEASLGLIKLAQHYMNILTKYAFLAARSLEIYTLVNKSKEIRFDYGYIHPDKEAGYKSGTIRLSSLITWYQESWSSFANLLTYKEQYENYFTVGNWVYDYHKISITDAALLNEFKVKHELNFSVDLAGIPSSRFEAKAETVFIALVGATSNSDSITTIVEHTGRYAEKKRNGQLVEAILKPRSGVVIAKQSPLASDIGVLGGSEPGIDFWGRGLAADWCLYIEQGEINQANVNLTYITEIQVWFVYQSFLISAPAQGNQASVIDGTLIEDETGKLYVTYGGAKMIIPDTKALPALGLQNRSIDKTRSKEFISGLPIIPKNNTVLRSDGSRKIYVISKGVRLEVGSTDVLTKLGRGMADVKEVTELALDMLPYGGLAK